MLKVCRKCRSEKAEVHLPYAKLSLCPECFKEFYVNRIRKTVKKFRMFEANNRVGVAISGGKDSSALLHALHEGFPDVELVALHVDLGITHYSPHCRRKAEELAKALNVNLYIFDLEKELGFNISDFQLTHYKRRICSACGAIKRHVFEVLAERADAKILATGHNLDDVVATMLNNFFSGNWSQLVRLKPVLKPLVPRQTVKVKPLIKTPEQENLLYCFYANVPFREIDCPHVHKKGIQRNQETLRHLSKSNPNFLHQTLNNFLELISILEKSMEKPKLKKCKICGFPALAEICAFCKRVKIVLKAKEVQK